MTTPPRMAQRGAKIHAAQAIRRAHCNRLVTGGAGEAYGNLVTLVRHPGQRVPHVVLGCARMEALKTRSVGVVAAASVLLTAPVVIPAFAQARPVAPHVTRQSGRASIPALSPLPPPPSTRTPRCGRAGLGRPTRPRQLAQDACSADARIHPARSTRSACRGSGLPMAPSPCAGARPGKRNMAGLAAPGPGGRR